MTTRSVPSNRTGYAASGSAAQGFDDPLPRRHRPSVAVAAVLFALVLGALLNGPGLVRAATSLEVGPTRTVALRVAEGVERAGAWLGLDRPRRWLAEVRDVVVVALGGETVGNLDVVGGAGVARAVGDIEVAGSDTESPSSLGAQSSDDDRPAGASPVGASPVGASPDGAVARNREPVSADAPLEVLLVGDSLIGVIADGFSRVTAERDDLRVRSDVRISTGLARPDVLDWHRHLAEQLSAHDPDVVVLMLGGNDDQSLTGAPDGVIHLGQDGWEAEYERRITELIELAAPGQRTVVWLGLPAMRPQRLEETRPILREAAQRAVDATGALLLDTDPILAPGGYTARIDGVRVRADDGVHLTHDGGDQVAEALVQLLQERRVLPMG